MPKERRISSPQREIEGAYWRTLYWFFAFPTREASLSDLAIQVQMSKTTATVLVNSLVAEGFLRKEILGRLWRLACNPEHLFNTTRKIPYHLQLIYESGILAAIHEQIPSSKAIVLFGSYRKGDDNEASDIDIAVEIVGNETPKVVELGKLQTLGYRKNVRVNMLVFSRNNIDLNLFANIANGILLQGFLEVRP